MIAAEDEETVTIPKETFYEMNLLIQHYYQEKDDEFHKYDFEKEQEEIRNMISKIFDK